MMGNLRWMAMTAAVLCFALPAAMGADARIRGIYTPAAGGAGGQWAVFADVADASNPNVVGISSLSLDVLGAGGRAVTTSSNVLPRGTANNGGEGYGFWLFNSDGTISGGNAIEIGGAQLTEFTSSAADQAKFGPLVLRGVGLQSGAVAVGGPYASATAWDVPVVVAKGQYTGGTGTLSVQRSAGTEIDLLMSGGGGGGDWSGPGNVVKAANVIALNGGVLQKAGPGDANLDGHIDFTDLVALAQNYGQTGRNWFHGDFDYDGQVGFTDLVLLAQNYNGVVPPDPAAPLAAFSSVPEPGAFGAIAALGIMGLLRRRAGVRTWAVLLLLMCGIGWRAPAARASINFGQIDTFTDGTTMGWSEGTASPNPPTNVAAGGPDGAGDAYLQNVSSGGFGGAGSKQAMFNDAQWTGDYNAAGVTRIEGKMANFGTRVLKMRVALRGGPSGFIEFGSNDAITLPVDGGVWHSVAFDLTPSAMTNIVGTDDTLASALSSVNELRIMSAAVGPAFQGDVIASTLGVDDLRATRLAGDANFDGRVSFADFQILERNFGKNGAGWGDGDFNFDGNVDAADFTILRGQFGMSAGASALDAFAAAHGLDASTPEPGSVGIVLLGVAGGLLRRRGSRSNNRG